VRLLQALSSTPARTRSQQADEFKGRLFDAALPDDLSPCEFSSRRQTSSKVIGETYPQMARACEPAWPVEPSKPTHMRSAPSRVRVSGSTNLDAALPPVGACHGIHFGPCLLAGIVHVCRLKASPRNQLQDSRTTSFPSCLNLAECGQHHPPPEPRMGGPHLLAHQRSTRGSGSSRTWQGKGGSVRLVRRASRTWRPQQRRASHSLRTNRVPIPSLTRLGSPKKTPYTSQSPLCFATPGPRTSATGVLS